SIIKFVLFCFAVGCTPEMELEKTEAPIAPFSVKQARLWFDANLQPVFHAHEQAIVKAGETGLPPLIPFFDWSKAITGFNKDWSVVELPWEYKNGKVVFSTNGKGSNEYDFAADTLQLVRLVMAKNLNTNDVYAFKMVVLPDPVYFENGGNLQQNQYLEMQPDFSGLVLFYDLFGKFVVGYTYEQGGIVNKLTTSDKPEKKPEAVIRPKSFRLIEISTCWFQWGYDADGNVANFQFLGCSVTGYVWEEVIPPDDLGGGGGGGYTGDPFPPIGGGGGGGGVTPPPADPPQIMPQVANPCEKVQALGTSELFRNKMAKLIGYTGKNFEAGYLMRNNHDGTFSYEPMSGPEGTLHIDFFCSPQSQIFGFIHTHPTHGLPIFSPTDLQAIYLAYRGGCIENLEHFPIGVVTPQGTYMLVISDVQRFLAFGSKFLENRFNNGILADDMFKLLLDIYSDPKGAFLKLLKGFDSGLMLFEGSHADFSQWLNLKLDPAGNPVVNPNPC
ncbi:MAG TPA: hypothetical protein VLH61_06735, partial [Bacteroidales bacterium]|nr:hypothetical protein [Bacteroidales bacterium]